MPAQEIATEFVVALRTGFSLEEHREFVRRCAAHRLPLTDEQFNEIATIAQSAQFNEVFKMAKKAEKIEKIEKIEKVEKPAKVAKPVAAKEAASKGEAAPRREKLPDDTRIVFQKENPKRVGSASHKAWEQYCKAKTIGQLCEMGGSRAHFNWDYDHGFITLA